MPKAFTYYDMERMIATQFPAGTYTLEVHEQWFRANTSKIPTMRDGELLEEYAFDRKEFFFQGSDVQFHGKAMGIPLSHGIWFRVHFLLHGHGLPCIREEKDTKKHTFILAAIVGLEMCVILVDRYSL